jgi:hypothetical protein
MASRCLYCGQSPWRPFRWLSDQDFCSNKHRELYRARLQRVVGELTKDAKPADEAPVSEAMNALPATENAVPHIADGSLPVADAVPEVVPVEAKMAPSIVLGEGAMAQELTEMLHLEKEGPTTVWLPPDIFQSGLQPRAGQTCGQISTPIIPISGAGARKPIRHAADALPSSFVNHVQIKRWGLKITFQ